VVAQAPDVSGAEDEAAARLLERLLADPEYRASFRADPVSASRAAGLDGVAREMAAGTGKVMQTLDERESRSSLAGVLMAAALEGAAVVDFSQQVLPHLDEVPRAVGDVLAGLSLPGVEDAQAATPRAAAVAPVAGEFKTIDPEQATAASAGRGIDASQFGLAGGGGSPVPGTDAVLHNPRVSFDADGVADLKAGRVDPRLVSVLQAISHDHTITESTITSGHDRLTTGGSVSNHYYGRAIDISVVDGQPVGPGNAAARKLAVALSKLPASIRPTEIGSPWSLPGAAYFTDAAHQNHVHIGFDDPVPGGWKPPEGLGGAGGRQDAAGVGNAGAQQDAAVLPAVSAPRAADEIPAVDTGEDSSDDAAEPGGLEDPGGDTDAEADAESDGGGSEGDDSGSDDQSDEQENDEADGGDDGDHDDSSDSGSADTSDSDGSDGGEDDDDDSGDAGDGSDVSAGGDQDVAGGNQVAGGNRGVAGGGPIDLGDVAGSYPGDHASQAQIAAWMGAAAQKRGLPPELPVMAGLVESHLSNLGYGDADSVGFFQMRQSVWNKGAYAGYGDHAELQLKWFLDQAAAVKRQRVGAGKSVTDPGAYGDWIADIERPATQYRGRYQLQLGEARDLLQRSAKGGGGRGGGHLDGGRGGARLEEVADGVGGPGAGPHALAALHEAEKHLGEPYHWGGSTPQTGFDCSGLVQWAYAKAGIRIPRTSEMQILATNGKPVGRGDLRPGDLVFFRDAGGDVHHVGMSLGGDRFINAPHTGDVVKIASLKEPYYSQQYTGARRFDTSGRAAGAVAAAVGGGGGGGRAGAVVAGSAGEAAPAEAAAARPAIDQAAVQSAQEALLRDAAEAQRPGTLLFNAVQVEEQRHMAELGREQSMRQL
jgi:NlpC/P60 family